MSKIDVSDRIERLEAFEEQHAVRIENASAWFDDEYDRLSVLFELHPKSGTTISKDMYVVIAVYNKVGQIMESDEASFWADDFWGFALSNRSVGGFSLKDISKIRMYPTLR